MSRSTRREPGRLRRFLVGLIGIALVGTTLTAVAVATDTFGAGHLWLRVVNRVERFMAGPVPDRPTIATVKVKEAMVMASPCEATVPRLTDTARGWSQRSVNRGTHR